MTECFKDILYKKIMVVQNSHSDKSYKLLMFLQMESLGISNEFRTVLKLGYAKQALE